VPSLPIDDENLPLFTVGQVAATLEVQHAFLRRLDEFNVVRPSRSAGGQRRYTRLEVTRVAYVLRLVEDGLTLSAVRRVLQLEAQVRQLEERVRELESERDALAAAAGRDALAARPRPFGRISEPEGPGQP
jgi:MerR family transcriptional regulator, heat shock protein HspR